MSIIITHITVGGMAIKKHIWGVKKLHPNNIKALS